MKPQLEKELSAKLVAATEDCKRARTVLAEADTMRSELPSRLTALANQLKAAKLHRDELSSVRTSYHLANEPFDETEWNLAAQACDAIEKEISEAQSTNDGFRGAIEILLKKLSERREQLCLEINSETAALRRLAIKKHGEAVQLLKDALSILDLLNDGYSRLNVPAVGDDYPGNAFDRVTVSPDIERQLDQLRPFIYERDRALQRLLRF